MDENVNPCEKEMLKLEVKMGSDWVVSKVAETEAELKSYAERTFGMDSPFVRLSPNILLTEWRIVPAEEKNVKMWKWGYYRL